MEQTLLYRCPGPYARPGGTYAYQAVSNEAEKASALAAGWFLTLPEAVAGKSAQQEPEPADDSPPTRAELEQRAAELRIKVDGRWSEARLAAEIAKGS